ncbi:MAG: hypothetical protein IT548_00315 [Alphaproteobacteria bacterium]|nr:hypothetical protein [Alphaproteobacteria bacterium]
MAKSPFQDPIALWRDMLDKWEKQVNETGNKVMGSEQFSGVMGKASTLPLQMQKLTGEFMAKYLSAMNLPSRDDIVALGERLGAIEDKLHRIGAALDAKGGPAQPFAGPPRTRKPAPKAPQG